MELEKRFYTFTPNVEKRDDGTARLYGYPIVFNSPADIGGIFREIVMPGALDGADLKDVPLLVNHNDNMIPVARSRRNNGNSTMFLTVDEKGLRFEATLDISRNPTAAELYSAVERGDIDGMSYGFRVSKENERWEGLETNYPTRYINRFTKIFEISACTFPAYDASDINARSKVALDSARAELDSSRQHTASNAVDTADINMARLRAKIKIM